MTNNNYNEKGVFNYDNYISEISYEGERWRPFGGNYFVSDHGRVYSLRRGKMLKPALHESTKGSNRFYYRVQLWSDGKYENYYVHRLVATLFIQNLTEDRREVHHINADTLDNRASNLQWVSPAEHRKLHSGKRGDAA